VRNPPLWFYFKKIKNNKVAINYRLSILLLFFYFLFFFCGQIHLTRLRCISLRASLLLAFWHLSAHERYCECGARARMFYYLGGWGLAGGLGVAVVVYIRGKVNSSCCSKSLGKPRPLRARSGLSECEPVWRYFRPKARTARIVSLTLSDRSSSNLGHDFMILGRGHKQTQHNT